LFGSIFESVFNGAEFFALGAFGLPSDAIHEEIRHAGAGSVRGRDEFDVLPKGVLEKGDSGEFVGLKLKSMRNKAIEVIVHCISVVYFRRK